MSKELTVIEQKDVDFQGDEITAVLVRADEGEQILIPLRPICDALGVDWSGQRQRINRDPVLSDVVMSVGVTPTDIDLTSKRPRTSEMLCIPLDYLNGWLFGINANRVKEEIRGRLIAYQRECYRVLAAAFQRPDETAVTPQAAALLQIRAMGEAITRMADELLIIEQRQTTAEKRLDRAAEFVGTMNKRLTAVERQVRAGNLTEEQASEIKNRVNQIAQALTEVEPAKSHYPTVYAALQNEAGVTSYKAIPPAGFEAAVKFLDDWLQAIRKASEENSG